VRWVHSWRLYQVCTLYRGYRSGDGFFLLLTITYHHHFAQRLHVRLKDNVQRVLIFNGDFLCHISNKGKCEDFTLLGTEAKLDVEVGYPASGCAFDENGYPR